jgi:cytochrome c-type biogenesis protein CcmF
VENVALLPWLTATAFLHSVMVQERRGTLKVWNLALVIASFALAIFGTFVVRSGVLSSVHAFAQSAIGPFVFGFLAVALVVSLSLLLSRLPLLGAESGFESLASREAAFLLNNLLLAAAAAATFWGTVFPLVSEAARGVKVSVGAPYYQQVNGPLLLALLVLMGVGPLLAWRRTSGAGFWRNARWPLAVAGAVGASLALAGVGRGLAVVAFAAAAFTLATIAVEYWCGVRLRRRTTGESYPAALAGLVARAPRRYGGYLVHLGIVLLAAGVTGSSFYQTERAGTLARGESLAVGRYTFTHRGLFERAEPGVRVVLASLEVRRGGDPLGELQPARRIHRNWEQQPVTAVAYRTVGPWLDDLYVLLTGWDESGAATFRVFVNPLVSLLWAGGALFLFGALVCAWPTASRRRPLPAPEAQAVPVLAPRHGSEVLPGVA